MRIALLEDDIDQARIITLWLEQAGHRCVHVGNSREFLRLIVQESFDILILDWILPDLSGIEVLKRIRQIRWQMMPILFVTQLAKESNIVEALESGADDYMCKPVSERELIARVNVLGRRGQWVQSNLNTLVMSPYVIDEQRKSVSIDGEGSIDLTQREFELVLFFFRNIGKIISRAHLLEAVWGLHSDSVVTRTVDTHVGRIRKKLNLEGTTGWKLTSIYRHGYRLERLDDTTIPGSNTATKS